MPRSLPLARVTDPDALAAAKGPRAQLSIEVPRGWFISGVAVEVVAPKRLACQRCEGGGCDSCSRAGVWRAPEEPLRRTLRLQLPVRQEGGVTVRLVAPFEGCDIEQLLVNIRCADNPSKGVRRLPPAPRMSVQPTRQGLSPMQGRTLWMAAAMAAVAMAAAVAAWL